MNGGRRAVLGLAVAMVTAPAPAAAAAAAVEAAAPAWAPAATATIHPGVQVVSPAGQCTANFVFFDEQAVYLGQAAHCSSEGGATDTDGCHTASLPLGTPITVQGASQPGTLAYNSWLAMQAAGETDPDTCGFNDLALVRLHPSDVAKVNPSIPHWGGPVGGTSSGTSVGQRVFSYGNSILRLGLTVLSPKEGISLGDSAGGWNHTVFTLTPGIPGDSGSAFLDRSGRALGVLSTVQLVPLVGANGVGDLRRELSYLHASAPALAGVQLALGTEPFTPSKLPLGL